MTWTRDVKLRVLFKLAQDGWPEELADRRFIVAVEQELAGKTRPLRKVDIDAVSGLELLHSKAHIYHRSHILFDRRRIVSAVVRNLGRISGSDLKHAHFR